MVKKKKKKYDGEQVTGEERESLMLKLQETPQILQGVKKKN